MITDTSRRWRPWLCLWFVAVLASCTSSPSGASDAADGGIDAAQDMGVVTSIDALDALDTLTSDAAALDADGSAACRVVHWTSQGDAGVIVTNVRQYLSNCLHNEDTDLITWNGAIYLAYRTFTSQILSPDARLHVLRSYDQGQTFSEVTQLSYPGRDIRDPKFVIAGNELRIYSVSRVPGTAPYDDGGLARSTVSRSTDGAVWSDPVQVYPDGWEFWREWLTGSTFYATAYQDGDRSIILLSSPDGLTWTQVTTVFNDPCRLPEEPEPILFPDGRLVILIRFDDGVDYLGDGHEKICYADAPYSTFQCAADELQTRLDGPRAFQYGTDWFILARASLSNDRKRMVVYQFTGDLHDATNVGLNQIAVLPSAGDTSYSGLTWLDTQHALISWYTSNPAIGDPTWILGILGQTDIFLGVLDFTNGIGVGTPFTATTPTGPCRPLDDGGTLYQSRDASSFDP